MTAPTIRQDGKRLFILCSPPGRNPKHQVTPWWKIRIPF